MWDDPDPVSIDSGALLQPPLFCSQLTTRLQCIGPGPAEEEFT